MISETIHYKSSITTNKYEEIAITQPDSLHPEITSFHTW